MRSPRTEKATGPSVFISWAGDGKPAAQALRRIFVKAFSQAPQKSIAFVSDSDVEPGAKWMEAITDRLRRKSHAIFVLTPSALTSQWFHMEVGALVLGKNVARKRVWVIEHGATVNELPETHPLREYQRCTWNLESIENIMSTFARLEKLPLDMNALTDMVAASLNRDPGSDAKPAELSKAGVEFPVTPPGSREIWWTTTVDLPLDMHFLNSAKESLRDIRDTAQACVHNYLAPTSPTWAVRCCVFLLDIRDCGHNGHMDLFIPKNLHVGFDDERPQGDRERTLRLRPGQGVSGKAYSNLTPEVGFFEAGSEDAPPNWDLTAEQAALVHPELSWVLSIPLRDPRESPTAAPLGVLSVDGLRCSITHKQQGVLDLLGSSLAAKASALSSQLADQPRVRLAILATREAR